MGQSQARFRVVTGTLGLCLPAESYTADLVVAGYDNSPSGDLDIVMTTLFQAGRPILLYPHMPAVDVVGQAPARTVVFAWDGSRPAGRALREAVPHMLHADKVCLLRVGEDTSTADVIAEQDVMAYLRSHCVGAELVRVGRNHGVGQAILDAADSLGADLVAMGAYGHSHLGEMLLGGATDYVLKHGNLPLLLAH
ncbi:MAG: universal stress protein, partial [Asticcacaulis sp.]|nr:universal stress protein [Asticcacaulis sp.]